MRCQGGRRRFGIGDTVVPQAIVPVLQFVGGRAVTELVDPEQRRVLGLHFAGLRGNITD
jgi:hypothetical protein